VKIRFAKRDNYSLGLIALAQPRRNKADKTSALAMPIGA